MRPKKVGSVTLWQRESTITIQCNHPTDDTWALLRNCLKELGSTIENIMQKGDTLICRIKQTTGRKTKNQHYAIITTKRLIRLIRQAFNASQQPVYEEGVHPQHDKQPHTRQPTN